MRKNYKGNIESWTGSNRRSIKEHQRLISNEDTVSFIVIRNPLERIVSAYKDKIECGRDKFYTKKIGQPAVNGYRNKGEEMFKDDDKVKGHAACKQESTATFLEVVQLILHTRPHLIGQIK